MRWCFLIFRRVRKIAKSELVLCHVCLSVRIEQLGSHCMDFDETIYFRKSVEEIHVSVKSDKNNRQFT